MDYAFMHQDQPAQHAVDIEASAATIRAVYYEKWLYALAMLLIVIGAVNWALIGAFDFNLVTSLFGRGIMTRVVYILVGISALSVAFRRDFYLPFLGEMVIPCGSLTDRAPPGATRQVKVVVEPHRKVIYWAAEPAAEHLESVADVWTAYKDHKNTGVSTSDENGIAILKVREPQPYSVPMRGRLDAHVHYRVCGDRGGWLGRVQTKFVGNSGVEGFVGGMAYDFAPLY